MFRPRDAYQTLDEEAEPVANLDLRTTLEMNDPLRSRLGSVNSANSVTSLPPSPQFSSAPSSPRTFRSVKSEGSSPQLGTPTSPRTPNRLPYVPSNNSLMSSKMRYYRMLAPPQVEIFKPPDHILPQALFIPFGEPQQKVGSITTIFTIWNTMMGSGLLAMPWGFSQSGIAIGILTTFIIGFISYFSCTIILGNCLNKYDDFSDACERYIGPFGRKAAVLSSTLVMAGASIVYVVVIITCFFDVVNLFIYLGQGKPDDYESPSEWNIPLASLCCFAMFIGLTLIQEMSALMKFNRLGIINVVFQLIFFIVKSGVSSNGINPDENTPLASTGFVFLCGILMVSFFIHNAIIPIMKSNKNQENNQRDLALGFICVAVSYMLVGILPNLAFDKDEIEQNFLEIFDIGDYYAFAAKTGVFFQLATIYPLLLFVVRNQIFVTFLEQKTVTKRQSVTTNLGLILFGIGIAILGVEIGVILSYVGSVCGLVYIFVLPPFIQLRKLSQEQKLTLMDIIKYSSIIIVGAFVFFLRILSDFITF